MKFNLLKKSALFGLMLIPALSLAAEKTAPPPAEPETGWLSETFPQTLQLLI